MRSSERLKMVRGPFGVDMVDEGELSWVGRVSRVGGPWVFVALSCRLSWRVIAGAGAGGDNGVDERIVDHVAGLVGYVGMIVVDGGREITWAGSGELILLR